jgi:hypothetical protein
MTSTIFSLLLLFTAAAAPPQPATAPKEAALNAEFEVRVGRQVTIRSEGLRIDFNAVVEDSRCPQGVQCVWAGNAKVLLRLSKAGRRAASMRLNTGMDPRQADYRGYEVKLVGLEPYPQKDVPVKKKWYVAKLIVTRK